MHERRIVDACQCYSSPKAKLIIGPFDLACLCSCHNLQISFLFIQHSSFPTLLSYFLWHWTQLLLYLLPLIFFSIFISHVVWKKWVFFFKAAKYQEWCFYLFFLFLHISIVKFSSVHVKRKSFIHFNTLMQCLMLLVIKYDGLTFVSQTPSKFIF